MIDKSTDSSSC